MNPVLYRYRDSESVIKPMDGYTPGEGWEPLYDQAAIEAAVEAERDALLKDAERYRWLTTHARTTSEHWGGRWSIVIDGPALERHGCKDALDEAIDAAVTKVEGKAHD